MRGSREIKQFVQGLVNDGLSKPKVIESVVEKYSQDILIKKSSSVIKSNEMKKYIDNVYHISKNINS